MTKQRSKSAVFFVFCFLDNFHSPLENTQPNLVLAQLSASQASVSDTQSSETHLEKPRSSDCEETISTEPEKIASAKAEKEIRHPLCGRPHLGRPIACGGGGGGGTKRAADSTRAQRGTTGGDGTSSISRF